MRGVLACVCALAVGQALEMPCYSHIFMYFLKYEFVMMGSKGRVIRE